MNKPLLALFIFAISSLMYIFAEKQYNYFFCFISMGLFFINSFYLLKDDIKSIGILNFNSLFTFSFFLCSYAFAVILYPLGILSALFNYYVTLPEHVINKCTALCTCAFAAYTFGYFVYRNKNNNSFGYSISVAHKSGISTIYWVVFIALAINALIYIRTSHGGIQVDTAPFLSVMFIVILSIFSYLNVIQNRNKSFFSVINNNKGIYISSMIIILIYTIIGDRGLIVQIGLALVSVYSVLVKRIKFKLAFILFLVGAIFMYSIRITRNNQFSLSNTGLSSVANTTLSAYEDDNSILAPLSDLTERYEELYLGYEYLEQTGEYYYPLKIVVLLLSPFPLLPSLSSQLIYGVPTNILAIGSAIGKTWDTSAGTHCVMDSYAHWGFGGLILVFFVFGYLVRKVTVNFRTDIRYGICNIVLISQAVYLPRASLFDAYRPVFWTLFLLYLFKIYKKNVKS